MSIHVYGDKEQPEFEAGQQLASFLRESLVGTPGDLVIRSSIVLFGQKRRDLDLMALGRFPAGLKACVWDAAVPRYKIRKDMSGEVHFFNFVFSVEVKDHTAEDIRFDNTRALVRYRDTWSDATGQSDEQKYALINYLKEFLGWSPFVCNFIWFRTLEEVAFPANNFLPRHFGLNYLLSKAVAQKHPYKRDDDSVFYATRASEAQQLVADERRIFHIFEEYKGRVGALSRARLEKITKERILANQAYAGAIGKKLVLVKGRAGTGKTIKLLHIAYDLYVHRGERVLVLTYNQLLVSDIRRMLTLAGVDSGLDRSTVEIDTIHGFVRKVLQAFQIEFSNDEYLQRYDELKHTLLEYLDAGVITPTDIVAKRQSGVTDLHWDKVLIDEGQDWPDDEKRILFALFGSNNFVVACGTSQLVRSVEHADWTAGVKFHKPIIYEKRSLRQKSNLCAFEKAYAEHFDVPWDLEPSEDLTGGKVIIAVGDMTRDLIHQLEQKCVDDGNQAYEFLLLAPPSLTVADGFRRRFSLAERFENWGVHVWDGIPRESRSEFPTDIRQHRVTTYESARGLEGWVVACLELDRFHEYKLANPYILPDCPGRQFGLGLATGEEQATRLAHDWVMIALTRAIDTLVIGLHDADSN